MIELKHPFVNKCPDIDEFFKTDNDVGHINTINSLCHRITSLSEKYSTRLDPKKFKGDAFELFVEYMIKSNESDNRIGIFDYQVISDLDEEDRGVDGIGKGSNGNPAAVQVKFRTGDHVLTDGEDSLIRFAHWAHKNHKVKLEDDQNLLIVTTGLDVHYSTRMDLGEDVRVLNRDNLRNMYDNRPEFWLRFYESCKKSRVTKDTTIQPLVLRSHQQEAINEILKDPDQKGKVILPTGTGKSIVEAELIRQKILEFEKTSKCPVIKVNASGILLCFQLFEDVYGHLGSYGINAQYVNFNSGRSDNKFFGIMMRKHDIPVRDIVSSTSIKEVEIVYEKAKKDKLPLIIFSTYHSSYRFKNSDIIPDLTVHDEAHKLVGNEFANAAVLPSLASFYFTATEKFTDSDKDVGMNNEIIFGNTVYQKSAKEMIERGEMVQPKMHFIRSTGNKIDIEKTDADYGILFNSVVSAFHAHSNQIKSESRHPEKIGAKILVVCRGQEDLIEMFKTEAYESFKKKYPKIHIFALSSEFGMVNDGEKYNPPVTNMKKHKMIKKLKGLKSDEEAIVFHVDMIGEGIDVPGITGVIPFRKCEMSKFIQNIGRAARLHSEDRRKFYVGEINPNNLEKYIKPYSWVIIPAFLSDSEGFADRIKGIILKLRGEYGLTKEHVFVSNEKGLSDDAVIDVDNDITKKKKHTNSGIEGFKHEFEDMSLVEKVFYNVEEMEKSSKYWKKVQEEKGNIIKQIW